MIKQLYILFICLPIFLIGQNTDSLQIYSDTEREKAQEVRIKFLQNFPEVKAYMSHKSPYFKVVIGNFYTKLQAKKVQNEIQNKYNCYIVPSEIELITD